MIDGKSISTSLCYDKPMRGKQDHVNSNDARGIPDFGDAL